MIIFEQKDFSGGMNLELDSTKAPGNSYWLLLNATARQNVISNTNRHSKLDAPTGKYQGIYTAGSYLVVFISGIAYYADINQAPITFIPITGIPALNAQVDRIYAELTQATTNLFNRLGIPTDFTLTFNGAIASFNQCLLCFDGVNQPNAIFATGTGLQLGTYANWTKDNPQYVPVGSLPAIVNNKLFLADVNRTKIYHSVSGRQTDFVVNITNDGEKGGDASTVATAVSFNVITALRPLATGQLFVTTLYASYIITLDYTNLIFGEPLLIPTFLFPVGSVNEISQVDVLQDTAFITQSGIHAFNATAQAKRESNNFPFGAPVRKLLVNPQAGTCATNHDDYAFFKVSTIYGEAPVIYDTIRGKFSSLGLEFGDVKQFANTRIAGEERLFFITHNNEIYEAFASAEKSVGRIYLGDWTADKVNGVLSVDMIYLKFTQVVSDGCIKVSAYSNREFMESAIQEVSADALTDAIPETLPFASSNKARIITIPLSRKISAINFGLWIEWDFSGALAEVAASGSEETAPNLPLVAQSNISPEKFAFISDTGYANELNVGGSFSVDGYRCITVVEGEWYIYNSNGNCEAVSGDSVLRDGIFKAKSSTVAVKGNGAATFSLRNAENFISVLHAIRDTDVSALIGGGDHGYPDGRLLDVQMGIAPLKLPFHPTAGDHDYNTSLATAFFNTLGIPRYYVKEFLYVDFFFYNAGWTTANAPVNSLGITTGPTSEPDGNDVNSTQAKWLQNRLAASSKPYKIVVIHTPPYTTDDTYAPGYAAIRLPFKAWGANAVLSGHGHNMERWKVDNIPYLVCGTGGHSLNGFRAGTENQSVFRSADYYGYVHLEVDPLCCKLQFRNTLNEVLDEYAIYR